MPELIFDDIACNLNVVRNISRLVIRRLALRFFIIASFTVHDLPTFQDYSKRVGPILSGHGGRIRLGAFDVSQSVSVPPSGGVVVEFDSAEAAQGFFDAPDYAEAKAMFLASTQPDIVFASEAQ